MARKEELAEIFGTRLGDLRDGKKLTQKQLAQIINVGRSTVGHYEDGNSFPSFTGLVQLCDYFGVSSDYMLGRSEHPYLESAILPLKFADKPIAGLMQRLQNLSPAQQKLLISMLSFIEENETHANALMQILKK